MVVSRRELEGLLSQLTREVADSEEGLFGPESLMWRVFREVAVQGAARRAALLQLAHPHVSHAVEQSAGSAADPLAHFTRTFAAHSRLVFAELPDAIDAARRLYRLHRASTGVIHASSDRYPLGSRYSAADPAVLLWVFATFIDSALKQHCLIVEPLTEEERERYYQEARRLALLFGLARRELPDGWQGLQRYLNEVLESDALVVTPFAQQAGRKLFASEEAWRMPLSAAQRALTAGLVPHVLREPYGLPSGPGHQLVFWAEVRALRSAIAALPPRLRYVPDYTKAVRRLHWQAPSLVQRLLTRRRAP